MPSPDDLDQLTRIAREAAAEEKWRPLAAYFDNRGKGLRADALAVLTSFLAEAVGWPFDERLRLTRWLADRRWEVLNDTRLLPQPLLTKFVSPTLREWVEREPSCAEAHFLTAMIAVPPPDSVFALKRFHLRRAIALDPTHDEARLALFDWLTSDAEYNQHEIPWGYLGDPEADLDELREAEAVADQVTDPLRREKRLAEVARLREIARSWLTFRQSGYSDFGEWCAEHRVDLGKAE